MPFIAATFRITISEHRDTTTTQAYLEDSAMWLDEDGDFDPDSEIGRALMMSALDVAEHGNGDLSKATMEAVSSAQPVYRSASAAQPALDQGKPVVTGGALTASGHTYHSGPPSVFCSVPWGLSTFSSLN